MRSIDADIFTQLQSHALRLGLPEIGGVALDDPAFAPARARWRAFLAEGKSGDMGFLDESAHGRAFPEHMLEGAKSLIVAALPYRGQEGPIARYAQSDDYHTILHRRLGELARKLEALLPGVKTLICVDTRPVLERSAAQLAGLGFIGKHGCLITPRLGSYVLLGEIMTSASFDVQATRPRADPSIAPWTACGDCRLCLDACPTQAFDGPGDLDPRKCISYLSLEYRGEIEAPLKQQVGERIAGCDRCQEVCPYNQSKHRDARVQPHVWLPPSNQTAEPVDFARLLLAGSSPYRAFVRRSPLNRVPRRAMKRNLLVALSNRTGELSAAEVDAIQIVAHHVDAGLRSQARALLASRGIPVGEAPIETQQEEKDD